ncbi:MAG TPA: radical SAM protein [Gammaproteobacteria bacterium]
MAAAIALSQRGDVRLGYRCNARCGFCYYQDSLDNPIEKEPTTAQLRRRIELLRASGATEVEFTGGEPTIRPDLVELIAHAAALGFVNVSVITNGLRLAKPSYAKVVVGAGANDFLFSIHGHTPELHDAHTGIRGSFDRIMAAVRNVKACGARCRSSTTVTGANYAYLEDILGMLVALEMDCINLAVFSPVSEAKGTSAGMQVRYSDAGAAIRRAIERHEPRLPPLSVKYIPFCFMTGYEKYVMNLYQQSFDPDDWNYYLSNKVRRADTKPKALAFDLAALLGGLLAKDWTAARRLGLDGFRVIGFTRIVELLRKKRLPACRRCRYALVCDGPWRDYVARYGESEFEPVTGARIADPAWCYDVARYRRPGDAVAPGRPPRPVPAAGSLPLR